MNKTLMIAAALLTLGASAAFAGEDFPERYAAPVNQSVIAQQASGHNRLFPASTHEQTNVYGLFGYAGLNGGRN